MESLSPFSIAVAFGFAAVLFWVAGEAGAGAADRPAPLPRVLAAVAVLLAGCGLWWPGQAIPADSTPALVRGLDSLWRLLPALAFAGAARVTAVLAAGPRKLLAAPAVLVTLMLGHGFAMFTAPGLFRLSQAAGGIGAGAALVGLTAALIALQLPLAGWRHQRLLRASASLLLAALACFAAMLMVAPGAVSPAPDLLLVGMLVGMLAAVSAALLMALEHGGSRPADRGHARPLGAATSDGLTGLPTRLYFEARLAEVARKTEPKHSRLAVLFIDLDGFKPVNDSFGHSTGDRVLEQVGERLSVLARNGSVAARVGGDQFLLLAIDAASPDKAADLAQRVIETLTRPYRVDDREIGLSCSIGIAMHADGCSQGKLIARADAAMYAAKRAGGSRHCFYSKAMDADATQNFDMLRDLRQALVKNELELFFQPKIDARSGKVTAAEALIRWNHPTLGMVMPGTFIPLAERSGLIGPIGDWVIEAACRQGRAWREKGLRMRVAINLSAYQMRQNDIVERIAGALQRHRIHPSLLTCEITESAAMEDTLATQETFRRLGELGAHLSIDDFGTGYSSLSYLRQLPAEELKIDASFVKDLEGSADARAVVDAVVKLGRALGLKVVAEGVENPRQQQILVDMGCDELQGYLFAKPMSARALLLWALGDRTEAAAFRDSLFGETRQTTRQYSAKDAAREAKESIRSSA